MASSDEMDYRKMLTEIYGSFVPAEAIDNVIQTVKESSNDPPNVKFDIMVDMLSQTGNSEEATGERQENEINRNESQSEVLAKLVAVLSDADPSFLEQKSIEIVSAGGDVAAFIVNAVETKNYPLLNEYIEKQKKEIEAEQYTTLFEEDEFLKEYPEPFEFFENPDRIHALSNNNSKDKEQDIVDQEKKFALTFLFNTFRYIRKTDITKIFNANKSDIVKTAKRLRGSMLAFKKPRAIIPQDDDLDTNMLLLKEMAFIKHAEKIQQTINVKKEKVDKARKLGTLETCKSCFAELDSEACYLCSNGCIFCRTCMKEGLGVAVGDGKLKLGCMYDCGGYFTLTTLKRALDLKTFTSFWHNKQVHEIQEADIDGLEFCCLCNKYAYIPNPDDKIFHCEHCNEDSCRGCQHKAHVPLRCNEIEYDEDVKMRTRVENGMTEAVLINCLKCGKPYIKTEGCNYIACSCGGTMCYICRRSIQSHGHFGPGSCPLYSNENELHKQRAKVGAAKAKAELGVDKNPELLKFDPEKNL